MTRIAVDAMGGDRAPREIILGASDAFAAGHDVVLVGHPDHIHPVLEEVDVALPVVPATEVIAMDDDPTTAIREKKDASVSVAAHLVASGEAVALVSAGSTGAALAAAAFVIGRLNGVARPAIATIFPGGKVVLDSGANLNCRPEHLVQFAVMGSALAATELGIERPRVGLVNIGGEDGKGRDVEKEAFGRLSALPALNFVGNVEGHDIASDSVDVLVTDGFTGNVLLKTAEGSAKLVLSVILASIDRPELEEAMGSLAPAFADIQHELDPETAGGAHLLGTRGVVVIAHGSSSRKAIANAIAMAADEAAHGLVDRIAGDLAAAAALSTA